LGDHEAQKVFLYSATMDYLDHVTYPDRHIFTQIFYDHFQTFGIGHVTDP